MRDTRDARRSGEVGIEGAGVLFFSANPDSHPWNRMIGETVSHYRVLEKLGSGGMGDVYKAEDTKLKRTVALKFLPRELTIDEEASRRFIVEARAASSLDHANIGTIYEIDEVDGKSFIAMACYEGGTLRDRISKGPLSIAEAVEISLQLARGLSKAHAGGIMHRDMKPANVMMTEGDQVKIVDFGLAKLAGQTLLTKTGTTLGTAAYMSPEQASGKAADHRSDLWSVGVILYEMITGQRPFKGDYEQAVVYSLLNTKPEFVSTIREEVSPALERIVERALEKDPERRYQSANDLVTDLEAVREDMRSGGTSRGVALPRFTKRQGRKAGFITAGVVAVLVILLVVVYGDRFVSTSPVTIAVLPMSLESGDADAEWFGDGMTEALITDLAQIENLRVISRRSVMRYATVDRSTVDIARELHADYLVEGSVSKQGNVVRVSARLVEPVHDEYVWAERYDSEFSEVLATQSRIAMAIAEKIHGKISPDDRAKLEKPRKIDPKTYEAYLKGMHHLAKYTPEDIRQGLSYLHEAVEESPGDALAWAGLALGYITVGHGPTATPDARQRARVAAKRAITLDSTLAEAQAAFAMVKEYYDWDWVAARKAYELSIELNPSLATSHYHYAWMLVILDDMDGAVRQHELAVEFDPLYAPQVAWMGDVYRMAGRRDDALRSTEKALELGDVSGIAHLVRGNVFLDEGRLDEAVTEHEKMVEGNLHWRGFLGATYAKVGREKDALRVAEAIKSDGPTAMDAFQLAVLYAELGDADEAFRWANYEPHHVFVPWLATSWMPLHRLEDDPRYDAFLDRLNLPRRRVASDRRAALLSPASSAMASALARAVRAP